ncbi:MAG: phosphoglucomutase/phosphomannomutase family protein [Verrucomicrobia bacterium]|nr:phosphoglucomutase/phosphomannomutase family protein [Verrucomicrobiota bacterium]
MADARTARPQITFGTDGWRGVIADTFTFDSVRTVSQAAADYLLSLGKPSVRIAIGYDTRFQSETFAALAAEVLAANGIRVDLSTRAIPSPCVSWAIKERGLDAGIMFTASHNPPQFNGFKFKADYAGSADKAVTSQIEAHLYLTQPKVLPIEEAKAGGLVKEADFVPGYLDGLRAFVDFKRVAGAGFRIVADAMYGAQQHLMSELLGGTTCTVETIRGDRHPDFPDIFPEPIPPHTRLLEETTARSGADVGLAVDGDADRIGACMPDGTFVSPHQIFAMLLLHFLEHRKARGIVAKTISSTTLVEKIARKHRLELVEVPIGFKHICELLRTRDVLIGGEESGGIGYAGYIPERDGTLSGLLLLELMATTGRRLDEIMAGLDAEYGTFRYRRVDVEYPLERKDDLLRHLAGRPIESLGGSLVVEVKTYDGVKFIAENDDWLLVRPSGTEPVLRIYAEAKSFDVVDELLALGEQTARSVV